MRKEFHATIAKQVYNLEKYQISNFTSPNF